MYIYTLLIKISWKILCFGVDYKQNVKFLPNPYTVKSISLKKSAYKNKASRHTHNFFLLYYSVLLSMFLLYYPVYYWAKFHEKILYLGVDFKQNVDFLPSPISRYTDLAKKKKKSIFCLKSTLRHNFFHEILHIYILVI